MTLAAHEQLILEMLNRARLDPLAEAARLGIGLNDNLAAGTLDGSARQVLVSNPSLEQAATAHSLWMLDTNTFSHTGVDGTAPWQRAQTAGYGSTYVGENLSMTWSSGTLETVATAAARHDALFRSAGHRANMLNASYKEVGLSYEAGPWVANGIPRNGAVLTEKLGAVSGQVFLTGVAYDDSDGNEFYGVGEAVAGVSFTVAGQSALTESAGGYGLLVAGAGAAVAVTGSHAGGSFAVTLDFSAGNVKLDLVDGTRLFTSGSMGLGSGIEVATLLGVANLSLGGTGNANHLSGNKGANLLQGHAGADTLDGGAGNDTLDGGLGADTLAGGIGDDTYVVDSYADVVSELAGEGTDTVQTTLSAYSIFSKAHVEHLTGLSATGQTLTGNAGANVVTGAGGHDTLTGSGGDDTLTGNGGHDRLEGGTGTNRMEGGAGDDTYVVSSFSDVLVEGAGAGTDTVLTALGAYSIFNRAHVEHITSTTAANVTLTGNALDNILTGNATGHDTLAGSSGHDTLRGLGGNDRLDGGAGHDSLEGGAGADTMLGGLGDDIYVVDSYADGVIEGAGQGTDTVQTTLASYSVFGLANIENLTGTGGTAGGAGQTLTGNAGANRLTGGIGNDHLLASAGDDTLLGNGGHDTLTGGSGADVFVFNTAPGAGNIDRISDFSAADDAIHLENGVFAALGAEGALAAAAFHSAAAASTAAHRVIYNPATGALLYDADGAGGAGPVQIATLNAGLGLTFAEFSIL